MLDQRDRIKSQLRELELALTTTEYKIAKYGGAPDDDHLAANAAPQPHLHEGEPL